MSSGRIKLPPVGFTYAVANPKIERVEGVEFPKTRVRGLKVKKVLKQFVQTPIFDLAVELSPTPIQKMLQYIKRKLAEPSTSRGLTGLAAAIGYVLNPDYLEIIIAVAGGIIALIEMIRDEEKLIITVEEADDQNAAG